MGQSVLIQKMHCCTENSHEEVLLTLITGDFVSRLLGRTGVEPSWPAALSGIVPSKTYSVKLPFNYYEPIAKFPRGTCCLLHFQPTLINEIIESHARSESSPSQELDFNVPSRTAVLLWRVLHRSVPLGVMWPCSSPDGPSGNHRKWTITLPEYSHPSYRFLPRLTTVAATSG